MHSCQEESAFESDETQGENITFPLANLLTNLATNDGSIDNILDGASCVEIILPVNVVVNGLEITVNTQDDLQVVEAILDNELDDEDSVEIVFPITITLPDFTNVVINNEQELLVYSSSCNEDNIVDEDIECLDFVYPITFSIFNTNTSAIDAIDINNDQELYSFITNISENEVISLNYPLQVLLWDGSLINVNSQNELEITLEVAQDACDEDDDNDYNDDDNINQTLEELSIQLIDCPWEIETLVVDSENLTNDYTNFYLDFNENFTVSVFSDSSIVTGNWTIEEQGESFRIHMTIDEAPSFNNSWLVHAIETGDSFIIDLRNSIDILRLEKNCSIDDNNAGVVYTFDEVTSALQTCEWVLDLDLNGDYFFYDFTFNSNQTINVMNLLNGQTINGNWELTQLSNGEFVLELSNLNGELSTLNQTWTIQGFMDDFISLENAQGNMLTMSQTCPNDLDLSEVVQEDNWRITYFELNGENQTSLFSAFIFDFESGNQVFAIENGVDGFLGYWEAINNDLGMNLNFGAVPPLSNLNSDYWIVLDLQTTRVELVYQNGQDLYVVVFQTN